MQTLADSLNISTMGSNKILKMDLNLIKFQKLTHMVMIVQIFIENISLLIINRYEILNNTINCQNLMNYVIIKNEI